MRTLAGKAGQAGGTNGRRDAARLNSPYGIALDKHSNLVITDMTTFTVRRISPAGEVRTLAGLYNHAGFDDGPAASARFDYMGFVAVNASGVVYVADSQNHVVRKIAPNGTVSTLAGNPGISNNYDGKGTEAYFDCPEGMAVDAAGTLYLTDGFSYSVRKVTAAGEVTTIAGQFDKAGTADGKGTAARFYHPSGIAVDATGTLYVCDQGNHTIRKVTPSGEVTTLAGKAGVSGYADGQGTSALFSYPTGITIDAKGVLYVADTYNQVIRTITPTGKVSTLAGVPGSSGHADGPARTARFLRPNGLVIDSRGVIYVADTGNHTVRVIE
ncbi:hypothetical protein GCM10027348_42610 [Hymenobacter tenuis]